MQILTLVVSVLLLAGFTPTTAVAQSGPKTGSPLDDLPPHIRQATTFGERPDWSHDGKRILFMEKTYGDVYEVELETKVIRPLTHHFFHEGFLRAFYLSNGDILLQGARRFDSRNPLVSRHQDQQELWVLKSDLSGPPTPLGRTLFEGAAVSRTRLHIAWSQDVTNADLDNEFYPHLGGDFHVGDIQYVEGIPELTNITKVDKEMPFEGEYETQNFRPPDEKEIIFAVYHFRGEDHSAVRALPDDRVNALGPGIETDSQGRSDERTETMGVDIATGRVTNYSKAPGQIDEPEGIFPDGRHTLVECDGHYPKGPSFHDIYKLALDGSGRSERLTYFSDYPGYKATNPVVSDDGRYIAFQYAKYGDPGGTGRGVLIFDLVRYGKETAGH
jgi:hypothetical protein